MRRRRLLLAGAPAALILAGTAAFLALSPRLTPYVDGPEFRAELNRQTSKGLHFQGAYESIRRTGLWTAESPRFRADDGVKAMKSMDARGITGRFNPWGVLLRRWQLDWVHVKSGKIEIQTYEPKPPEKKRKPWYAIFLPDRVYLREVVCDEADILWRMRGEKAGFFGTRLLITPHGRDFEYRASRGTFVMTPAPRMAVDKLHMLITKEKLSLYFLELRPDEESRMRVEGTAGLKGDKSIWAKAVLERVPICPWMPDSWGGGVAGRASGELAWKGADQTVEHSSGEGRLRIEGGRLIGIPLLDYLASAARNEELKELDFSECALDFAWKYPRIEITNLAIEAEDNFRVEGAVTLNGGRLSGTVDFGVTEKSIAWLPKAKEEIFTRAKGGYLWTKVRVSGTLDEPENDLVPRMADALKRSPGAAAGLFLRQVGEWLKQKANGN